jgi:hypothetical protein
LSAVAPSQSSFDLLPRTLIVWTLAFGKEVRHAKTFRKLLQSVQNILTLGCPMRHRVFWPPRSIHSKPVQNPGQSNRKVEVKMVEKNRHVRGLHPMVNDEISSSIDSSKMPLDALLR